jgi:hypothetical protein
MDNNNQEQSGFIYTYSARDQAEIKRIRDKYITPTETEDKMARLRRLDASVTNIAQAAALAIGLIGTLILGFGMSLLMSDLPHIINMTANTAMVVGVIVGIFGAIVASLAYPLYTILVETRRKRIAPEIIRLTDELLL